jgi:hypothetical protein
VRPDDDSSEESGCSDVDGDISYPDSGSTDFMASDDDSADEVLLYLSKCGRSLAQPDSSPPFTSGSGERVWHTSHTEVVQRATVSMVSDSDVTMNINKEV